MRVFIQIDSCCVDDVTPKKVSDKYRRLIIAEKAMTVQGALDEVLSSETWNRWSVGSRREFAKMFCGSIEGLSRYIGAKAIAELETSSANFHAVIDCIREHLERATQNDVSTTDGLNLLVRRLMLHRETYSILYDRLLTAHGGPANRVVVTDRAVEIDGHEYSTPTANHLAISIVPPGSQLAISAAAIQMEQQRRDFATLCKAHWDEVIGKSEMVNMDSHAFYPQETFSDMDSAIFMFKQQLEKKK